MSMPVHLVGSVGLDGVPAVFEAAGRLLGTRLRRVPDGEPGGRRLWVSWQYPVLRSNPFLQVDDNPDRTTGTGFKLMRKADGVDRSEIRFGELGYAREARASYEDFRRARARGALPKDVRFQVCLPTPLAVVYPFCSLRAVADVEPAYERAMLAEVEAICAEIPHADLALQWDVCIEMVLWDGRFAAYKPPFANLEEEIVARLARICMPVPAGVELGFHLCYGDWEARHFIEPLDMGKMVALANRLAAAVEHPIAFIHMPVPIDRADEAYFAPLRGLALKPGTELYLGVVHAADGVAGARRRIAAARRYFDRFGIATECGMGRCKTPAVVSNLLELHAAISDAAPA